jgi:hypothetical protein
MYPPEEEGLHPTAVVHTMFLDRVDGDAAGTILEHLAASEAMLRVAQLRVLGGRWPGCPPRRPRSPTAARRSGHRRLPLPGPADKPGRQAWLEEFAAALGQGDDGASTGFLGEDGPAPISQAYPESTWDRLVEVKARYDPTNLFRHNHNLPAAG